MADQQVMVTMGANIADLAAKMNEAQQLVKKVSSAMESMDGSGMSNSMNTVGSATQKASKEFQNMGEAASSGSSKASKSVGGLTGKIKSVSDSFTGLNGAITGAMGAAGMSSFKSMTVDLTLSRMKTKELMAATMGSRSEMESFYNTLRNGTKNSVVRLDMMVSSMNGIKLSTGMSNDSLRSLQPTIQKVGEASLLMGDDAEHATFVMKEAMAGLNGDFAVLKEQFGITREKMMEAGWDGSAEDIDGYREALDKCMAGMGDLSKVMDSTTGKIERIKGDFRTAGLEIGEQFVPYIDAAATAFLDLEGSGSGVAQAILWVGGGVSTLAGIAPTVSPILDSFSTMRKTLGEAREDIGKLKGAFDKLRGTGEVVGDTTKIVDLDDVELSKIDRLKLKLKDAASSARKMALDKIKGIPSSVTGGVSSLKDKLSGIGKSASGASLAGKIKGIPTNVISSVKNFTDGIKNSTLATKLSAAGSTIAAGAETVYAGAKAALGTITTTVTGAVASFNATLLANPILIVVIAIIALVAILAYLYKNNEQVRNSLNAVFNFIKGSLMGAWQALQPVIQAVADTLKNAWNAAVAAFQRASNTITMIINVIKGAFSKIASGDLLGGLSDLGKFLGPLLQSLFPMPNLIAGVFQKIAPAVMPVLQGLWDNVVNAFMGIGDAIGSAFSTVGQTIWNALSMIPNILANLFVVVVVRIRMELFRLVMIAGMIINQLRQAIVTRFNMILARARVIWSMLTLAIRTALTKAVNIATQLANRIRTAIQQKFQQIVNKARSIFQNIVSAIRSKLASAASTARDKAVEIYNNIKNKIAEIPQQVADEFGKIPGKIRDALAQAASVAASGAASIVSNFLSHLGRASPGYIQRETVAEFKETAERLTEDLPRAKANASKVARSIVESWSSEMPTELKLADVGFSNPLDPLNAITATYDANIIGHGMPPMAAGGPPPMANNNMTDNRSVVNNNYHVDRIELDCNNLSTRESRQILYKALDGLYNGGV